MLVNEESTKWVGFKAILDRKREKENVKLLFSSLKSKILLLQLKEWLITK